jgi:hypothetical protein
MKVQKTRAPARRRVNQVKNGVFCFKFLNFDLIKRYEIAREPGIEATTGLNLPKQRLSLYRTDAPSPDPNSPTPFDLLLQRQDMTDPGCLQTPDSRSTRMMSESSASTTLAIQTTISQVGPFTTVIISDSEEEDDIVQVMPKKFDAEIPILPDVFQRLNTHRIKVCGHSLLNYFYMIWVSFCAAFYVSGVTA